MTCDCWSTVFDGIMAASAAAAVIFYFVQTNVAKHTTTAQSVLSLFSLLQSDEAQKARMAVMKESVANWKSLLYTEQMARDANHVCNTYDLAGILVREGIVPAHIVIQNWGSSIVACYERLDRFVGKRREGTSGPLHWQNFEWLYGQAVRDGVKRESLP